MNTHTIDSGLNSSDLLQYSTNPVTLTVGRLAFLAVSSRGVGTVGALPSSVTGAGQTWELVDSAVASGNQLVALYRCLVAAVTDPRSYGDGTYGSGVYGDDEDATGAVTTHYPAMQSVFGWSLFELSEAAIGGNGKLAILQVKKVEGTNIAGSSVLSLDRPMHTPSRGILVFTTQLNVAIAAEAGWTEVHNPRGGTPTLSLKTASRMDQADSAVVMTWSGTAAIAGLLIEISPRRGHFQKHALFSADHSDVVRTVAPAVGDALVWNGSAWAPGEAGGGGGGSTAAEISIADTGANFVATNVETALAEEADARQAHVADTSAHRSAASQITISDSGANFVATDVEGALAEEADARQAHEADTSDAHDASAISIADTGANFVATDVEAALAEEADARQAHEANASIHGGGGSSSVVLPAGGPLSGTTPSNTGQTFYDPNSNTIWIYDGGWLGVEAG